MTINQASLWRQAIARQLAHSYAANPKIAAVMLGGSSARGHADQYSDIEIGVFWHTDPSLQDRQQVIDAVGADLIYLYDYDPDEQVWCDDYMIGRDASGKVKSGILIEVCHYMVHFMESTLQKVLKEYDTRELSHNLISGVVDGIPLHGADLLNDWKARAGQYPRALAAAVVQKYGVIDHFWRWEMFLERNENLPLLYQSFSQVHQRLLHMLLGLNRVYYFGFKWIDVVAERLPIKPDDFLTRIREAYKAPPAEGARQVIALVEETFTLVEAHLPEVNVERLREIFRYRRPFWAHSPVDIPPSEHA